MSALLRVWLRIRPSCTRSGRSIQRKQKWNEVHLSVDYVRRASSSFQLIASNDSNAQTTDAPRPREWNINKILSSKPWEIVI